jgi:leader peptidase (prepilin peptidase)/N-methyltransferase
MVGSFLNVCIFRLPRNLSVQSPARSFCPHCNKTIPWWQNVPLLAWLLLRGRCASCKQAIPFRYFVVELLTAVLFSAAAFEFGPKNPALLIPLFVLIGLLVVATFVDIEHLIIPDQITIGGTFAGLLLSPIFPALHSVPSPASALFQSILGAATGYGVLWAVVELGRLAFGRKRFRFSEPVQASWIRENDDAALTVGEESSLWSDFFFRGSERVRMGVQSAQIDGRSVPIGEAEWTLNELRISGQTFTLNSIREVQLKIHWIVVPREAMGFGDVKLLAAIGAFLGWKAALFCIVAACNIAILATLPFLLLRRTNSQIPFGPYLATGALLWIADGPHLWESYVNLMQLISRQ